MSETSRLHPLAVSVEGAVAAFLDAPLSDPDERNTRLAWSSTLRTLASNFSGPLKILEEDDDAVAAWFTARWHNAEHSTWNWHRDAMRAACHYWREEGWLSIDPTYAIARKVG